MIVCFYCGVDVSEWTEQETTDHMDLHVGGMSQPRRPTICSDPLCMKDYEHPAHATP